jgi:hypothetical protein
LAVAGAATYREAMGTGRGSRIAVVVGLAAASLIVASRPAASVANAPTRCTTVAGAARLTPKWRATPGPVALHVRAFRVASCNDAHGVTATATGELRSASAACPLAPADRLRGPVQIDWRSGAVTYIKAARVASTGNPDDPFEVRLDGRVTGGSQTGATLRVRLDLVPSRGDCGTGAGAVTIRNTGALTIGGPYASCDAVAATATVSPGLASQAAARNLHFDAFHVSGCGAADTAPSATIIGQLGAPAVSCPPAKQQRFVGMLEIDWSNRFVSILKRAHLASTNNPDDPYELSLHGEITSGADAGATLAVVLHATPTAGDCTSGVTGLSFTNAGPFTIT